MSLIGVILRRGALSAVHGVLLLPYDEPNTSAIYPAGRNTSIQHYDAPATGTLICNELSITISIALVFIPERSSVTSFLYIITYPTQLSLYLPPDLH